jgi:hypothetical protein
MERHLFGVTGDGLRLKAGHRYRVVAVYDNPTPDTLVKGAMGSLVGIFAPRNLADWPRIEPEDSLFRKDLRFLARRGNTSMPMRHDHASMSMPMPGDSAPMTTAQQHDESAQKSRP